MPLDRELFELASRSSISREPPQHKGLDLDLFIDAERVMSQKAIRQPRPPTGAQQEEMQIAAQEESQMQQARAKLEKSPLPGVYAYGVQAGAPIVSSIARLLGKAPFADTMTRTAAKIEQAQREREKGGPIPDILQSGLRGAGASLTQMFGAGMVGGPAAAIGAAAGFEANRAITEGKDAGKTGVDLAKYAITQGVIEGAPAAFMQKIGLGGIESLVGKRAVATGIKDAIGKFGVHFVAENVEEQVTEYLHNAWSAFEDVDPEAMSPENIRQTAYETGVQTTFAFGFGHAVSAGRTRNITEIHAEIEAYAKEKKTPSRRVYKRWNLGPGLPGDSISQRRAFVQEMGQQLEALEGEQPAQPARTEIEDLIAPPAESGTVLPIGGTEVLQTPVTPEVAEGVQIPPEAQTAVTELLETPTEPIEAQVVPDQAPEAIQPTLDPQEGDDSAVALNKAASNEMLETFGRPKLSEDAIRSQRDTLAKVSVEKADERALEIANEILSQKHQGTDYDHAAMALRVTKLMKALKQSTIDLADASARGDTGAFNRITARVNGKWVGDFKQLGIIPEIEILARSDAYAARESARALSIRNMWLSQESFDVVDIIQGLQAAKGPEGGPLTEAETKQAGVDAQDVASLTEKVEQRTERNRTEEEKVAKAEAQKILETYKPKTGIGKKIREAAAVEREEIKAQIRAIGYRVNDITGISAEGLWLMSKLAVAHIKGGVGTLIELVEQMQTDFPHLALTNYEVYQVLLQKDPKLKARRHKEGENTVRTLKAMAKMYLEIEDMANGIMPKRSTRAEVSAEMKALRKKLTLLKRVLLAPELHQIKIERAYASVEQLQSLLDSGQKRLKRAPAAIPEDLAKIRAEAAELRTHLRVKEELENVNRQLETGEYDVPATRIKRKVDPVLERLQIELSKKKAEVRQRRADAVPWTKGRWVKETAALAKAVKATADISFAMRQNMWQVFSHPIRTTGAKKKIEIIGKKLRGEKLEIDDRFLPSMSAFFSEYSADQIYNAMTNSSYAFEYERSGLGILDPQSKDAKNRSEIFMNNVIERSRSGPLKYWGAVMRASSRHAVTIGNLIRTSAFDQFMENHPNATSEELTALADYLNVSTGIGNLGNWGAVADTLQVAFFSPKFVVSRFQTPYAIWKYRKQPRVRKLIARDMVKVASTGVMLLILADLAGFEVEWWDVDDPDWLKIRRGDTRWSFWGGGLPLARLNLRAAKTPFRDESGSFGPLELGTRFITYKISPFASSIVELLTGKTLVGEKAYQPGGKDILAPLEEIGAPPALLSRLKTIAKLPVPLVMEDMYDAHEEDLFTTLAVTATVLPGMGAQTYRDSRTAAFKKIRKFYSREEYEKAAAYKAKWNQGREPGEKPIKEVTRTPRK